ncbi:MerR family transcriptional regulator [Aeromicrobium sp. IC_218]|uniref:MerR family transcriptional regulator n=1 Tax=Aeromicrobium sp. IC_218 TaxID=2545468 RepID=UPI0013F3C55C|nr:MerR family transcriptional regulator [Aeromicrobium sp. IC_218]
MSEAPESAVPTATPEGGDQPPGEASSGGLEYAWTIATVSQKFGISASTLRTWERRYGLSPSARTAGGHRRYNGADLDRVQLMQQLLDAGIGAQDAAKVVLSLDPAGVAAALVDVAQLDAPTRGALSPELATETLVMAAAQLNVDKIGRTCAQVIQERNVAEAWQEVFAPALDQIGRRSKEGSLPRAAPHLAAQQLAVELGSAVRATRSRTDRGGAVLLASACRDEHWLPMLALQAALAQNGIASTTLGTYVPLEEVAETARLLESKAVFLWASTRQPLHLGPWRPLWNLDPRPHVVLGGPGWGDPAQHELPTGVEFCPTLGGAASLVRDHLD